MTRSEGHISRGCDRGKEAGFARGLLDSVYTRRGDMAGDRSVSFAMIHRVWPRVLSPSAAGVNNRRENVGRY